jgi:hypothetical protein
MNTAMNRYIELYAWMWRSFGREEFTIDRFRMVFPTDHAAKVIHDLVEIGYIQRLGRGRYFLTTPDDLVRRLSTQEVDDRMLEEFGREYAFCDSTAVAIWTDGYYWTGFTRGFRPVHIAVKEKDVADWKAFLRRNRIRFAVEGSGGTLYGKVYMLNPRPSLRIEVRNGAKVVPLEETLRLCQDRAIAYGPALEYLEQKHGSSSMRKKQVLRS